MDGFVTAAVEYRLSPEAEYPAGRVELLKTLRQNNIYYEVHTIPETPHPFWLFHPWFDEAYDYVVGFLGRVLKD